MTGLPQGWAETALGDVCELLNGRAYSQPELLSEGKYPVLRVGNLFSRNSWYHSDLELDPDKYIDSGDLIYAWSASFGPRIWQGGKVIYHYHIWKCALQDQAVDKQFLYNLLLWDTAKIKGDHGVGSTMMHVTKSAMEKRQVPLPPLLEQRRIVRKLDTLSARTTTARNHLTAIEKLVERYKSGVLRMAFRGDLTVDYRKFSSFLSPIEFDLSSVELRKLKLEDHRLPTDKAPYQVPASWRWIALPALGELARGKSKHRPRNDKVLFGGHYPFIQTGDVGNSNGRIKKYSATYSDLGLSQSRLWPAGTLCITIAANIAETGILEFDSCFPDSIVGFMADEGKTSSLFIEYFIRTVRADLEAFAPGVAQKNINLNTLSGVFVPTPPLPEQCEIVRRIETAFAKIDRLAAEAAKALKLLSRLDQRILAKAFAGDLVPQDPTDEPAEALLARIREARAAAPKPKRGRKARA